MATAGNTYFLRSLLLLVEGALYITRQILEREIERKKGECNLKTLLTNCENKLKHQFHGKQYKKLFPEYDDPDIYKWDLQLSIGVLLNVFERTLTLTERKNLRSLKELRNEKFMHCASPSLDQQQYEDVQEELDDIITSLAATFDEHVKERCSSLILQFATGPLDGVKPSLATLNGFSQGCQKKFKVCVNTELVVGGPSEHWTNLCERILDTILNNADSVASAGADYEEIRTNVKKMLDFLQSNKDVVFKGSKMECVVLCFECDSYDDFLQFVEMFDMQELQAHLDRLSEALMRYYKLSSRVHISCRVRTESLQFALIDVIGEMCFNEKEIVNNTLEISTKKGNDETISLTRNMAGSDDELCNTEESKQSLSLELECTSREGLLHTLSSFQKEEFSDKLTSIADALSRHVRQNITLKASLNVQDVMEAIEESDVHHIYQEVKQEEIQYGDDNIVVKYKKALACELPERWIGIENEATKMADTQDSASISEAEIDQLTMPKAMRLCRDNQIKLEGSKELDKIKWLIKYQLLCQGKKREEVRGRRLFYFRFQFRKCRSSQRSHL